ncbi:MAG: RluA family pseudouridine synthase [Candidatus Omnitrophica bacterium]|jgi:RluA family pseudouridine synthase|nr:RluA family pseudouridine synthase [Candidatus Omnitrophota bacterium]
MNEPFRIIFEDEYIAVLDKQAKILVLPSPKKEKYTLTALLQEKLKIPVYPCHRLDRETTGLIIYAKNRLTQEKIMNQFRAGTIKKNYLAFVRGRLKQKKGMLSGYVIDKEGKKFGEKPKKAKTAYRVLIERSDYSMLALEPFTGRTNQLRIQLADIGNPILGERKYAFGRDFRIKFKRLALHACFLSFNHPATGKRLQFELDLPPDMKTFLSNANIR